MVDQPDLDQYRHEALVANTAQSVRNYLIEMNNNRVNMRARWIWELLQNARDASTGNLVSIVKHSGNEVSFTHNGSEFEYEQISHLIYHGSTKVDDEGTIGRYGSGFLTTHLLSPQIDVSGRTKNGQSFEFALVREIASPQSLSDSMDKAWEDFKASLAEIDSTGRDFTTHFRYPIGEDSADAVQDGIATLQRCAPLVLTFNQQFRQIDIESPDDSFSFEVSDRLELSSEGLHQVKVVTSENGHQDANEYILAQSEDEQTSVAVLLWETDNGKVCSSIDKTPRLFLGFPLVGTEGFSFPGIINGFDFTPMENRDGVYLGQADNEANAINQATIEKACALLVEIIQFAASSKYEDIHTLAEIPSVLQRTWINENWLRDCLKECLVEPIRQTVAVLRNFDAEPIAPKQGILPFAQDNSQVQPLWDLLSDVKDFRHRLPRRDEAAGWCNATKSWASILECEPSNFGEAFDGRKLAELIDEQCDDLEQLQNLLVDGVCAVKWLNDLYVFLKDNDFSDEIRSRSFILDQGGYLDTLSNLYCDKDIDEELKNIADDLDLEVRRAYLRDNRLTSLVGEPGAGNKENKDVVQEIIERLKGMVDDEDLNDKFAKASVQLFGWIIDNQIWDYLRQYPAFCRTVNDREKDVIWLGRIGQDNSEIPLAPVEAWPEDLRQFAGLFPPTQILADEFYEVIPDSNVWNLLAERNVVRASVITVSNAEVNFEVFLPNEPLNEDAEHRTAKSVPVSNVVFLQRDDVGIMERIRRSQRRARLFWRFVTEHVAVHDSEGLEIKEEPCGCGEVHPYYRAEWLIPVANNKWVPIGNNISTQATAQSLASLLRDSEALPIPDSDAINKLLEAIHISRFDLMRESMSSDDESRDTMDNRLMNIMAQAQDNPDHLDAVPQFLEQLKNDDALPEYLAERSRQRKVVHQNQKLGKQVEVLVRENLESEGFVVEKTHIGADLIVRKKSDQTDDSSEDDVTELKLTKGNQNWLVEVKATRDNDARMTPAQARNAVTEGDRFFLCVVPVEADVEPTKEYVRANMRFIEDIGSRVSSLCDDLNDFEQQRSDITTNYGDGFQLVVMSGTTRIRVDKSVWKNDGFCLSELSAHLK